MAEGGSTNEGGALFEMEKQLKQKDKDGADKGFLDLDGIESIQVGTSKGVVDLDPASIGTDQMGTSKGAGKSILDLDLDLDAIESIQVGTVKGIVDLDPHSIGTDQMGTSKGQNRNDQMMDLLTQLHGQVKDGDWLEQQNKAVKEGKDVVTLAEKGGCDLDLGQPADFEIITSGNTTKKGEQSKDEQLIDILTELHGQIKGSDWLKQQNEAVKERNDVATPAVKGGCDLDLGRPEDFEIISSDDQPDELSGLMRDFYQSLKSSNWLEENTVEHMKQKNPDLIASIMESRSKSSAQQQSGHQREGCHGDK